MSDNFASIISHQTNIKSLRWCNLDRNILEKSNFRNYMAIVFFFWDFNLKDKFVKLYLK